MASTLPVADVKQLIVNQLTNDSTIRGLVPGKIYGEFPDLVDLGDAQYPLIVLSFRSGRMTYEGAVSNVVVEVWAVSRVSNGQATKVYDAISDALQGELLTLSNLSTVVYCQETQRPLDGYDKESRTWAANGRWIARAIK